ncbi:MAG: NUDIX domain-containing protein [Patescibacteria group bacterium]
MAKYITEKRFADSFKDTPRVAIVLFIRNKKDELLLVRRGLPPDEAKWSLPGAFLLKKETLNECVNRIAVEKLGIELSKNDCRVMDVVEYLDDPRGHVVQVVYKYRMLRDILLKPWGESAELAYFGTVPSDMAFNHAEIVEKWYNSKL